MAWCGDDVVFFFLVCNFIGIIHGRVIYHDFERILEVDIAGLGLGSTGSAVGTAVAWDPLGMG
jgi:hypothetical protein